MPTAASVFRPIHRSVLQIRSIRFPSIVSSEVGIVAQGLRRNIRPVAAGFARLAAIIDDRVGDEGVGALGPRHAPPEVTGFSRRVSQCPSRTLWRAGKERPIIRSFARLSAIVDDSVGNKRA